MCLYPKLIKNRKYVKNKKNGGNPPVPKDQRVLWVPVGCQKCMECKKQKSRQWSVRLQEEIRTENKCTFVTLTFSDEEITKLKNEIKGLEGYELDNEIATLATRRFLERWRKKHKKSLKHWLVTELGHNGTENIHLHGILWSQNKQDITEIWKYGWVFNGDYVNEKTVNYISKYINKTDEKHPNYNAKILTSAGIGKNYINRSDSKLNKYKEKTDETYKTRQGKKLNLPIYYRNKLYTEDEREKLWLEKLDKQERWICGEKVSIKNGTEEYHKLLRFYQAKNRRLGYGDDEKNWDKIKYENERRKKLMKQRTEKEEERIRRETAKKLEQEREKKWEKEKFKHTEEGWRKWFE